MQQIVNTLLLGYFCYINTMMLRKNSIILPFMMKILLWALLGWVRDWSIIEYILNVYGIIYSFWEWDNKIYVVILWKFYFEYRKVFMVIIYENLSY